VEYPDQTEKGLYLRVTHTGKRSWVVRKRPRGSKSMQVLTLGEYPRLSLPEARAMAREALNHAGRGEDIGAHLRAPEQGVRWGQVAREWLDGRSNLRPRTLDMYTLLVEGDLSELDAVDMAALTRVQLVRTHRRIHRRAPVLANRALSVIKMICAYAVDAGYLTEDLAASIRRLHSEKSIPRPWDDDELAAFWRLTREVLSPLACGAFRLRALTACRRQTVLLMRWDQLRPRPGAAPDPAASIAEGCSTAWWDIPPEAMKGKRSFSVPITGSISQELRTLWTFTDDHSGWVFPGRVKGRPISSLRTSERALRTALIEAHASAETLTFHGLRDTAATSLQRMGASWEIIQRVLDHKPQGVTARYAGYDYPEEHRRWLDRWCRYLLAAATGDSESGEVLRFPGAE